MRRCGEFKRWKKETSGQTVQPKSSVRRVQHTGRNYHVVVHPDIPLEQQSESTESSDLFFVFFCFLTARFRIIEYQYDEILSAAESPDLDIDLPEQQQHLQRTVPDSPERTQQRLQRTESPANPPGKKIMELKIPLLKPSVVTETLQIVTQETLGNSLHVL